MFRHYCRCTEGTERGRKCSAQCVMSCS